MNSPAPTEADNAVDQLNAAFDTYMHHEALADARRVGRELRRLGVQRRIVMQPRAKTGWDSLTDSELKVVNLIAQGATNRSVAQRLHVTPHTVKAHLHNAFAKLGINSRAELSRLMHGTDRPDRSDSGDLAITPTLALNINPRAMVLGCPRGDRSSRQLIAFSLERRPRLGQTPRRWAHEEESEQC